MNKEEVRKHIAIIHNMAKDYGLLDDKEISRTYQVLDYISNLEQENKQLKKKIDKITEYIENELYTLGIRDNRKQKEELLEILKGEDND